MAYGVDGEAIPMVSLYKYLGCVMDEHLVLTDGWRRAEAERRAPGACFQRCQAEIGDVGIGIFRKLWGSIVESNMMYGVEIWGCSRHLEPIEQVQLWALRMFFGVGTLHPKASLLQEVRLCPLLHHLCHYQMLIHHTA